MSDYEKDTGFSGCEMLSVSRTVTREILGRHNGRNVIQQISMIIQERRSFELVRRCTLYGSGDLTNLAPAKVRWLKQRLHRLIFMISCR